VGLGVGAVVEVLGVAFGGALLLLQDAIAAAASAGTTRTALTRTGLVNIVTSRLSGSPTVISFGVKHGAG